MSNFLLLFLLFLLLFLLFQLVKGLLSSKIKGRWGNTQENCLVLLALKKYFDTFEKSSPNFVARTWLDDLFAGEAQYKQRTPDAHEIKIPMAKLQEKQGLRNLIIDKVR